VKPSDDSKPTTAGDKKQYKKQVICFNCNEEGQMSYNCPNDLKSEEEERGSAYASSAGHQMGVVRQQVLNLPSGVRH
jgi:hypothetical protein